MSSNDQRQAQGTGFVNLNKILGANSNNQLANTVNTGINNDYNEFNQGLTNAQNNFGSSLNDQNNRYYNAWGDYNRVLNTVNNDPEQVLKSDNSSQTASPLVNQGSTPTNIPTTPYDSSQWTKAYSADDKTFDKSQSGNAFDRFANYRNAKYEGAQGIDPNAQSELSSRASGLKNVGSFLTDPNKKGELLSQYGASPYYSSQNRALDSVIYGGYGAQSNPSTPLNVNNPALLAAAQGRLNASANADTTSANSMGAAFHAMGGEMNKGLQAALDPITQKWTDQANQYNAKNQNQYTNLKQDFGSGKLSDEDLAFMGLPRGLNTWGLKNTLGNYLTQGKDVGLNNVIGDYDRSRIRTLEQLKGDTPDLMSLNDAKQAGALFEDPAAHPRHTTDGYLAPGNTFNTSGFNTSVNNARDTYNQGFQNTGGIDMSKYFNPDLEKSALNQSVADAGLGMHGMIDPNLQLYEYADPIGNLKNSLLDQSVHFNGLGQEIGALNNFEQGFNDQVVNPWRSGNDATSNENFASNNKKSAINQVIANYQKAIADARGALTQNAAAYGQAHNWDERL